MLPYKKAIEKSTSDAEAFIEGFRQGRSFHIIFNRPAQSNAFTFGMYIRLHLLFERAGKDPEVDNVILYARGKNFSAGNDLNNFAMIDFSTTQAVHEFADTQTDILKVFTANLLNFVKPIICCCQGAVIGFIFPLISIFDFVYVTEDAYFAAPMIKMEQSLEMFGSYTFPALFGPSRSFDINAIGRKLTAAEAVRTGFALQAFATHEEMLQHAIKVGAELSATNQFSVVEAKKLLREPIRKALWNANIQELANLNKVWKDPAFVERLQRYMNSIALKAKL